MKFLLEDNYNGIEDEVNQFLFKNKSLIDAKDFISILNLGLDVFGLYGGQYELLCKKLWPDIKDNLVKYFENLPLYYFRSIDIQSINIPVGVKTLPSGIFHQCKNLKEVTIPNTVTTIENIAFSHCIKLRNIIIPDSVTTIGGLAFTECENLEYVSISENIRTLDFGVFENCTNLSNIKIPNNCKKIQSFAFRGCTNLNSIIIPPNVNFIDHYAFSDCSRLKEVTFLGNTIELYRESLFENCKKLKVIKVPKGTIIPNTIKISKNKIIKYI